MLKESFWEEMMQVSEVTISEIKEKVQDLASVSSSNECLTLARKFLSSKSREDFVNWSCLGLWVSGFMDSELVTQWMWETTSFLQQQPPKEIKNKTFSFNVLRDTDPERIDRYWRFLGDFLEDPLSTTLIYDLREVLYEPRDLDAVKRVSAMMLSRPPVRQAYDRRFEQSIKNPFEMKILCQHPPGSLGYEYFRFLNDAGLKPLPYEVKDEDCAYEFYSSRMRKTHDIHHLLTDYPTSWLGEQGILGFYGAQNASPSSLMLLSCFSLASIDENYSEAIELQVEGFIRGNKAKRLGPVIWEDFLDVPLDQVREHFGIVPRTQV